jgi:hypothetical protein
MDAAFSFITAAVLAVTGFFGFANEPTPVPEFNDVPESVEVGIAEYSPMGPEGGVAIPASACGNPHTGGHVTGCIPTPTVCDSPTGLCCWVNGSGSCNTVCRIGNTVPLNSYAINPTPNGGQCLSGESRPSQAINAVGSGNPPFAFGCASGACSVANAASGNTNVDPYCYSPGQTQDNQATDRTVACFCEVTNIAHCSAPPAPQVDVVARVTSGGVTTTYTSDANIRWDDTVVIRWNNITFDAATFNCNATAGFAYSGPSITGSSPAPTPAPGATQPYRLSCTDSNGSDADVIRLTVPPPPAANLQVRLSTATAWNNTSPFVIGPVDNIHLNWTTSGADSCSASILGTGSNFSTGGLIAGTDLDVGEPPVGYYAVYRINCPGPGGNATDNIEVQRPAPTPILTVSDNLVDVGEQVTVSWNTNFNDPASCTLTGPGLTYAIPSASGSYPSPITINGESNFTLTCAPNIISPTTGLPVNPGGSDVERVSVTGRLIET